MDQRRAANPSKGSRPASAFAVYTAIATAFSSSQQSDQLSETPAAGCHRSNMLPYTGMPQCDEHVEEGSVRKELRSQPFVGASFQLAHAFDKMKSRRHKREVAVSFPIPCGCEFSTCGCEFSTCTCLRQDEILSPQETPASDPQLVPSQGFFELWVRVFPMWVRVFNLHMPSTR